MRLEGKTAIVTGGGGDIGRGIARCLAREGSRLLLADISKESAKHAAEEIGSEGGDVHSVHADLTREDDAQEVFRTALETLGQVDILVNAHGRASREFGNPLERLSLAEWNDLMAVNLTSVFLMTRAVLPHMRERRSGKIINIASLAGRRANENLPHYSASKAALISFTQSIAKEMAPHNVNVNAINPGFVFSPVWEKGHGVLMAGQNSEWANLSSREIYDRIVHSLVPLGRDQNPEDVGHFCAYLASEESRNMTGQSINLDGGVWML
jgi:NAD(P)-dependent dehydrogenase (short-subunit alcohol dehydrogenase family)